MLNSTNDLNNCSSAIVIGDINGYFQEQLDIEGIGYLFCFGEIQKVRESKFQLVVLVCSNIGDKEETILKEYLEQGGNLLVVNPSQQICKLLNIHRKGYLKFAYITCDSFPSGFLPIIDSVQLESGDEYRSICPLLDENRNSTHYDSIFNISTGNGNIGIVAFDLFETLYRITHGNDVTYKNSKESILRVDDGRMIKESEMDIPVADVMRSIIIKLILDYINYPVPRLWYFPDGCKSALCVTHDSDNANSGDILEVNKIDKELGILTTTFMSIFNGGLKSWRNFFVQGLDLQFHPVQLYQYHPGKIINAIQRKLGSTKVFLKCQHLFFVLQKLLFDIFSNKITKGIRFHGLQWNKLTDQPVWMSRMKIDFDSTLGSNSFDGYPYGTGLPYFLRHPETFASLNTLEFPMHIMDSVFVKKHGPKVWINVFFEKAKRIINEANCRFFSLTVLNLHHYILFDSLDPIKNSLQKSGNYQPGAFKEEILENYKELINYSKRLNLKIWPMSYFNKFWRERQKASIAQLVWDENKKELNYLMEVNDNCYSYSQILPIRYNNFKLIGISIDRKKIDYEKITIYNKLYAFFQLQKGLTSYEISVLFA